MSNSTRPLGRLGRLRKLLVAIATTALAAGSVIAFAPSAALAETRNPGSWSAPVSGFDTYGQSCASVLFVGVRGSAEHDGYGSTVSAIQQDLLRQMTMSNTQLTFRQVYIDYPAASVDVLKNDVENAALSFLLGKKPRPSAYFSSVDAGVTALGAVLRDSLSRCPSERWVIAGYSQGALVAHAAMNNFPDASRWAGALLAGDPANFPNNLPSQNKRGTAPAGARGNYDLTGHRVTVPTGMRGGVWSYCDRNDIVCDFNDLLASVPSFPSASRNPLTALVQKFNNAKSLGVGVHQCYASETKMQTVVGLLAAYILAHVQAASPIVSFNDANLKQCVLNAYNNSYASAIADISIAQLSQVSQLNCGSDLTIADLTGLQYATGLTSLSIASAATPDLTPIANLPKLSALSLSGGVSSTDPLSGNTTITSLSLVNCSLTSLAFVNTIPSLRAGNFDQNDVTDISGLASWFASASNRSLSVMDQYVAVPQAAFGDPQPTMPIIGVAGPVAPIVDLPVGGNPTLTEEADGSYTVTWPTPTITHELSWADAAANGSFTGHIQVLGD